jgi:hypothetical protein
MRHIHANQVSVVNVPCTLLINLIPSSYALAIGQGAID